eukprot:CCRYP_020059-RA/>CCRYP_020059-RA protein AED:0.51 eAED:0.10 QI:0/-1/0/1/-1/1/1/0/69
MAKLCFEEWLWETAAADMFCDDCKHNNQTPSFSGVGAKHQNAMAECAIQTIVYMARTFMIHVSLHWSEV